MAKRGRKSSTSDVAAAVGASTNAAAGSAAGSGAASAVGVAIHASVGTASGTGEAQAKGRWQDGVWHGGPAPPPGRPSSRRFVRQEAEQRVAVGTAPKLLKVFGSDLSYWLRETYPGLPQMTPRAVENVVRDIWRRRQQNI
jgi:hypothetical protein